MNNSHIKVKIVKGKIKVSVNVINNMSKSKQIKDKFVKVNGVEVY